MSPADYKPMPLRKTFPVLIRAAFYRARALYDSAVAGSAISNPQLLIMRLIWSRPLNQITISRLLHINRNNLVSLLDDLEDRKLVERVKNDVNRREYLITITEKGRRVFAEAAPHAIHVNNDLKSLFTDEEWDALCDYLSRVAAMGEEYDEP